MMPTANDVPRIVQHVRFLLDALPGRPLRVSGDRLDDSWFYIAVEPAQPGVSALDHANAMSRIERALRQGGDDVVLLVPAIEDWRSSNLEIQKLVRCRAALAAVTIF